MAAEARAKSTVRSMVSGVRWLACLVLVTSCATQRLAQARFTGAAAMGCAPEDLWVFEDEAGWSATGCGQIVSGTEVGTVDHREKATCESLARFEFRLCRAMARQSRGSYGASIGGDIATAIRSAQEEAQCNDQLSMRYASCPPETGILPGLPGGAATPATPPPVAPADIPPSL